MAGVAHQLQVQYVDIDHLEQHPRNANNGDVDAIVESIRTNGFYAPLYVQYRTRVILAGNHRYAAALRLGLGRVPVVYLDVDDETALRILTVDNRSTRLGQIDEGTEAQNLAMLYASDLGLAGTGYTEDSLQHLLHVTGGSYELEQPAWSDPVEQYEDQERPERERPEREAEVQTPGKRLALHLTPVVDERGECTAITVSHVGGTPISARDFSDLRVAIGAMPMDRDEVRAIGVPAWSRPRG